MSIQHLSFVQCDRCGRSADLADDGRQARALAGRQGWEYRNWNVRIKDVCPECVRWRRCSVIESAFAVAADEAVTP